MKRKKRLVTGQRLGILFIIIALVATTLITLAIMKLIKNNKQEGNEEQYAEYSVDEENTYIESLCDSYNWGKDIIGSATKEDIPIPYGYEYKRGNLKTGIVIRENSTGAELLWIPYQEDTSKYNVDEYYKNAKVFEMNSDAAKSIIKYGGFYVYLNTNLGVEDLKQISNDKYQTYAKQLNSTSKFADKHILSKEEIAQILTYTNNNDIKYNSGIESMSIGLYSSVTYTSDEKEVSSANIKVSKTSGITFDRLNTSISAVESNKLANKSSNKNSYYTRTHGSDSGVPIPSGFSYTEINGVTSIKDNSNDNLVYIWVPATEKDLENAKTNLKEICNNSQDKDGETIDVENPESDWYKGFYSTSESILEDEDLMKSIKQYGGFYVSEAELGYDQYGEYFNRARGMRDYSAQNAINGGDYYRKSSYDGSFNLKTIKSIAKSVHENDKEQSVVSHLMYGAEYDAMLLWIIETNKKNNSDIIYNLTQDSSKVGKYKDSGEDGNGLGANANSVESSTLFNLIWGLGGNLAELTQETLDGTNKMVIRGGNWSQNGNAAPIATRQFVSQEDIDSYSENDAMIGFANKVGFRTCLYLKPDLEYKDKVEPSSYKNEQKEEEGILFEIYEDAKIRYTTEWEGLKVYKTPSEESEVIDTLGFASSVNLIAKATEKTRNDLAWGKIELKDGTEGYINETKITKETMQIMDETNKKKVEIYDFVIKKSASRFAPTDLAMYKVDEEENEEEKEYYFTTKKTKKNKKETVEVVGKSICGKWALIELEKEHYCVEAKLLSTATEKEVDKIDFTVYSNVLTRYTTNWDGLVVFEKPNEESKIIESFDYATEVQVEGKAKEATSDNLWWAIIKLPGNKSGYVNAQELAYDTSLKEVENNKQEDNIELFLKSGETARFFNNGLEIYSKPDYSNTDILKAYSDQGSIKVLGKSTNGVWTIVDVDGKDGYVYSNKLAKEKNDTTNSLITWIESRYDTADGKLFIGIYTKYDKESIEQSDISKITIRNMDTNETTDLDLTNENYKYYSEDNKAYWYKYYIKQTAWYEVICEDNQGNKNILTIYYSIENESPKIYEYKSGKIKVETFESDLKTFKVNGKEMSFKKGEDGIYIIEYAWKDLAKGEILLEAMDNNDNYSKVHQFEKTEFIDKAYSVFSSYIGKPTEKIIKVYKGEKEEKLKTLTLNGKEVDFEEKDKRYETKDINIALDERYIIEATFEDDTKIRTYFIDYSE